MNKIQAKIILHLPLTEKEKAYAILYMSYSIKEVNYETRN